MGANLSEAAITAVAFDEVLDGAWSFYDDWMDEDLLLSEEDEERVRQRMKDIIEFLHNQGPPNV